MAASTKVEEIKPVYVLYGPDGYLQVEHRRRIIDRLLGDADRTLSLREYEDVPELSVVLDDLRTLPFLAPHRVVVVRNAGGFLTKYRDKLQDYLDNPSSCGSLVLQVGEWRSNTNLAKKVAAVGEAIKCKRPDGTELVAWIKKRAAEAGKDIQGGAASSLAATAGDDLAGVAEEVEKLVCYVGQRKRITIDDVAAVSSPTVTPEAFALVNAIVRGDAAGALGWLNRAMNRRGDEMMILGQLAWHVRRTLHAGRLRDRGESESTVLKEAKAWGKMIQPFKKLLGKRDTGRLEADMRRVLETDLGMKTGHDPLASLQTLVVSLVR